MTTETTTQRVDSTTRDGLRTAAGVLYMVAARVEEVATGKQNCALLEHAACVLEGQAVVLREWLAMLQTGSDAKPGP